MTFECKTLRDAARDSTCVRCGVRDESVVGAHYTGVRRGSYGGGLGRKVHDFCIADLCGGCHEYMDRLSRDKEGRWGHSEEFQHYVLLTLANRFEAGVIRVAHKSEAQRVGET